MERRRRAWVEPVTVAVIVGAAAAMLGKGDRGAWVIAGVVAGACLGWLFSLGWFDD